MAASMRDVAARAGVSPRTVSNVVNGSPLVAAATRTRVEQAMRELRYRPNAAARSLRRARSGLVALVVPEVDSPYFGEIAALLSRAAEQRQWTLLIEQTGGDAERERRLLDGMRAQLVDGVVFSPWALRAADLAQRRDSSPLVLLGERVDGHAGDPVPADHVVIDNVAAAAEATAHLLATGRRRIAAVGARSRVGDDTARLRLQGHHRALAAAGIPRDPDLELAVTALHRADGAAAVHRLLQRGTDVDALFCFTDQLALGAQRAAREHGLRVPEDLAVVGFDDVEDGRYATPSLTTISPDKHAIAERAAQCLAERLAAAPDDAPPPRTVVVGHRLLVRESSGTSPA
ncbi:DNA-binding LacI/PurR family transcriptional regulator [Kineococcus xinjiangensis]|uniref:DNA-binding LacI/PurR family transcriptional regulator n=1 Tax=Kineococcus xinjiangensis TaxID=512762 RepID=A0A2S6IUV6_9ACTN|nr:LacI family DNA-binding transcriptional regulator [Kineococcus xinjiangensis]PPK98051.1 DNA-binding LacI/PurR family transcriptional regulator [Kineococcus xinjiangensis]